MRIGYRSDSPTLLRMQAVRRRLAGGGAAARKRRLSGRRLGGLRNRRPSQRLQPLRAPEALRADIRAVERESEGLLGEIMGGV